MPGPMMQPFSTGAIPAPLRVDAWRSALGQISDVRRLDVADPSAFNASMDSRRLPRGTLLCNMAAGRSTVVHRLRPPETRRGGINATIWFSGRATATQHDRSLDIRPGSIVLRSEGDETRLDIAASVRSLSVTIPASDLEQMKLSAHIKANLPCRIDASLPLGSALEGMLRGVAQSFDRLTTPLLDNLEQSLVHMIGACWQVASTDRAVDVASDDHRWQTLERLIDAKLGEGELRIADVAAQLNGSVRWLQKMLARRGLRYENYLMQRRLERARELLSAGDGRRIIDICMDSGFNDAGHFSRSFRRRFGVTPSTFRRRFG